MSPERFLLASGKTFSMDPNGRVKVWRADVMRHAQLTDAVGDGPEGVLSADELTDISRARGPKPWQHG